MKFFQPNCHHGSQYESLVNLVFSCNKHEAGHANPNMETVDGICAWHRYFNCLVELALAFNLFNDWEKKKGDSFMTVPIFARLKIGQINKSVV